MGASSFLHRPIKIKHRHAGSRSEAIYGRIPTREWMLAATFYLQSIQEE